MSNLQTNNQVQVTIGMPVYNGEKYIKQALDSVLKQSFEDFELVISDNASTDSTSSICLDYAKKDSRIKYIKQSINIGGLNNFNYLLSVANGKYFTWLAHDDFLYPAYLLETVNFFKRNEDILMCACDFEIVDADSRLIKYEYLEGIRNEIDWKLARQRFFEYPISNVFFSVYGMYRLHSIDKSDWPYVTKFWTGMLSATEIPFLARNAVRGRVVAIPKVLRGYRRHAESSYAMEVKRITKFSDFLHRSAIVFDQVSVAIFNKLSVVEKFEIIRSMIVFFFKRLKRKIIKMFLIEKQGS